MSSVSHVGTIIAIQHNQALVSISRTEACRSCDLQHHCMLFKQQKQINNVPLPPRHNFKIGEQVQISLSTKTCWTSIIVGYILPLLVMIGTAVIFHLLNYSDNITAFISLLSLIPYYIIVYLLNRHRPPQLQFTLQKINSGCNPEK